LVDRAEPAARAVGGLRCYHLRASGRAGQHCLQNCDSIPNIVANAAGNGGLPKVMAIDARYHRNILFLPQHVLIPHFAMADFTVHLPGDMRLMTKENELGEPIHSNPGNFLAFFFQLDQFLDGRTFLRDGLMAKETLRHIRNLHLFTVLR
jgi:hypothetical protein